MKHFIGIATSIMTEKLLNPRPIRVLLGVLLGFMWVWITAPIAAQSVYHVDPDQSYIRFETAIVAGINVPGEFQKFEASVTLNPSTQVPEDFAGVIDTMSLNTDNKTRDRHLRSADFFHVKRFPKIRFESHEIVFKDGRLLIGGRIAMKDEDVDLVVSVPVQFSEDGLIFSGSFDVNRFDLGLRGFKRRIKPGVQVHYHLVFKR